MHQESKQFLDGILLGAITYGLMLGFSVVAALAIFSNLELPTDPLQSNKEIAIADQIQLANAKVKISFREDDINQSIEIQGKQYVIQQSVQDMESGLVYRRLQPHSDPLVSIASIWSENGEQLLSVGVTGLKTLAGSSVVRVHEIKSDHELILSNHVDDLLIYDLTTGMVWPWSQD